MEKQGIPPEFVETLELMSLLGNLPMTEALPPAGDTAKAIAQALTELLPRLKEVATVPERLELIIHTLTSVHGLSQEDPVVQTFQDLKTLDNVEIRTQVLKELARQGILPKEELASLIGLLTPEMTAGASDASDKRPPELNVGDMLRQPKSGVVWTVVAVESDPMQGPSKQYGPKITLQAGTEKKVFYRDRDLGFFLATLQYVDRLPPGSPEVSPAVPVRRARAAFDYSTGIEAMREASAERVGSFDQYHRDLFRDFGDELPGWGRRFESVPIWAVGRCTGTSLIPFSLSAVLFLGFYSFCA